MKGDSPIQRVLGFQPHIPATLSDADYRLSEQAAASDPTSSLSQDLERRREAQKAFVDANFQQSVRSLLARNREQLRPETTDERDNRESLTETHMPAPNLDTIRGLLSKVKGPVRFVDLKGKERPYGHSPPPLAQPQQV